MRRRVKGSSESLAVQVADAVSRMRDSDVQKPPGIAEAIDWLAALSLLGVERLDAAAADLTLGSVLKYGEDQEVVRAAGLEARPQRCLTPAPAGLRGRDHPARPPPLAGTLTRRLHDAGLPTTPARAADLARALTLVRPVSRRLYWTARAILVSDPSQVAAFDDVFFSVFGGGPRAEPAEPDDARPAPRRRTTGRGPATPPSAATRRRDPRAGTARWSADAGDDEDGAEVDVPLAMASDEERLAGKSFDRLEPHELAQLYRLMTRLRVATPTRRTPPPREGARRPRIDMRRTLRASLRTGGDPIRLARRRRRVAHRRLVVLCDISGSMEALRARLPAVPDLRRGQRPQGRGVRVRHAADPPHPGARVAPPGARDPARRRRGAGLVERDPDRRGAQGLQRPARAPGHGRGGDRDPLRRLGARRPGPRGQP